MKKLTFELQQNKGFLNSFQIGMKREQVHDIFSDLNLQYEIVNNKEITKCGNYHIQYDEYNKVESIEVSNGCKIIFDDIDLFKLTSRQLVEMFKMLDDELKTDYDGIESKKLGIGFYCPYMKGSLKSKPDAIIVFKEGYYDKVNSEGNVLDIFLKENPNATSEEIQKIIKKILNN